MLAEPSKATRRLVGRLEADDDVIAALTRLCELQDVRGAEIRFYGSITQVDLIRHHERTFVPIPVDPSATFEIAQGSARVARMGDQVTLAVQVLLATDGPAGQQLVFGMLRGAKSVDVEFVIDVFEDIEIRRELESETGRLVVSEIQSSGETVAKPRERKPPERIAEAKMAAPTPSTENLAAESKAAVPAAAPAAKPIPEPEPEGQLSWAEAAKVSDELSKSVEKREKRRTTKLAPRTVQDDDDGEDDSELMRPGDILDHPKLGKCRIIRVEEDEYAHIRLSRGQVRKLALEICEIKWVDEEDGRNIFKVRIRK